MPTNRELEMQVIALKKQIDELTMTDKEKRRNPIEDDWVPEPTEFDIAKAEYELEVAKEAEEYEEKILAVVKERGTKMLKDASRTSLPARKLAMYEAEARAKVPYQGRPRTYEKHLAVLRRESLDRGMERSAAAKAEGLPNGCWRDPTGLVRNHKGEIVQL